MSQHHPSRRRFVGNMLALAGGSSLPFTLNLAAMGSAAAQEAGDYKALVCLFLHGGNDHFNTVLATDPDSWSAYQRIRTTTDTGSIALPAAGLAGGVLPITPSTAHAGRNFALHPSMQAMKNLFDGGRAAIVTNVGTLLRPTTLAQYKAGAVALPPRLFSHNDQQAQWQTSQPGGGTDFGWGGRMADLISASTASAFTAISTAGNALFLSGQEARQYQVSGTGPAPIRRLNDSLYGLSAAANPLRQIITADTSELLRKEHAAVTARAIDAEAKLSSVLPPAGAGGVADPGLYINPNTGGTAVNPLAVQLQTVARIIAAHGALGLKRQVFYVSLNGFDTHDFQRANQADLLARLSHAITYFDTTLASLQGTDVRKQVTLFTASDFGRTFSSNGDGTDHGWGSHHFVVGGAVKGKNIYGSMPVTGLGHELDVGSGALLPTISVDQYGATLASWFGLSATQITDVFPNIGNFSTRNLGFMNAV
ncbi:Uncharacterized conserved protein, DUF1501 family [Duganella sp. CF402]|uniref:DUF1501 domain-containing protein n=1 Tax=unclassified Duganella TaxID=2636909 RepID=UPI0008CEFBAC|nr:MULTISPECIES: DUF1501 domain-containing protein [unclassified Duganella]RZT10690.1 uncharacterized protein (DUF1501 family) [Duganella sp. BK701]SEL01829.1 Uncharacterized conserved protein, DUF1501 family [Duganella sp. CF402]